MYDPRRFSTSARVGVTTGAMPPDLVKELVEAGDRLASAAENGIGLVYAIRAWDRARAALAKLEGGE